MPDRPSSAAADAAASASPPSSGSLNSSASPRAKRLMDEEFVDTQHLAAFAKALSAPDVVAESVSASPTAPSSHVVSPPATEQDDPFPKGVEKLRAVSDFAPIHTKVKKRSRTKLPTRKEGISYHLARYPLLILLLAVIAFEFSFYVGTRQLVNIFEFLVAWTGHKRVLRQKLRNARTYEEWKQAALDMDEYLGFNLWKSEDEDSQYDWGLVRKVKRSLLTLREANDVRGVIGVLEVCLRPNFAGIERVQMYSETFYGSKMLIESYIDEVQRALRFVRESKDATLEEKKKFFKSANKNFGSSALCLSGGASFGYYHFGVVSAFLKSGTIPRVVTGTSAGALVAAMITTRTDDELRQLIVPELADHITACEEGIQIWLKRFWKTGARFDTLKWAEKATFFTRGSLTFREAYERTGRVLNVSVVPLDRHSPTKLLNYLTAPDCVIWSAIIASAAVPGILNPVVLMKKRKSGEIEPWSWGARFKDGSLRVDIPLQSLHLLFNVNYSIVSQVNPHVHLFFFAPKGTAGRPVAHRKGKGWRGGFLLSAMEQYLKLELTKNFKVIRDLELMPIMLGQDWSSVFLQRFDGSITIWPRTRFQDWIHILTDPDRQELARMIRVGELVTWPKLHMISNRERLEREILQGRRDVHIALGRERTINDTSSQSNDPVAPPNIRAGSSTLSIPIESDAERGFERQSLKYVAKRNGTNGKGIGQSRELPAVESSGGERRLPFILPGDGAPRRRSRSARPAVSTDDSDDEEEASHPSSSDEQHSGANSGRGFSPMQTLGSSFRQIRTQSFPTFQIPWGSSALTSPRSRAMDIASNLPPTKGQGGRSRRRSGGYSAHHSQRQTSDSSSSEDADELMDWGRVSGDSAGRGWRDTSGAEAGRSLKRA